MRRRHTLATDRAAARLVAPCVLLAALCCCGEPDGSSAPTGPDTPATDADDEPDLRSEPETGDEHGACPGGWATDDAGDCVPLCDPPCSVDEVCVDGPRCEPIRVPDSDTGFTDTGTDADPDGDADVDVPPVDPEWEAPICDGDTRCARFCDAWVRCAFDLDLNRELLPRMVGELALDRGEDCGACVERCEAADVGDRAVVDCVLDTESNFECDPARLIATSELGRRVLACCPPGRDSALCDTACDEILAHPTLRTVALSCIERAECDEDRAACRRGGFVRLEPGASSLGAGPDEVGATDDDAPRRDVAFTRGIDVLATEVTVDLWNEIRSVRPPFFEECDGRCPAHHVNLYDAMRFANELSEADGYMRCYDLSDCDSRVNESCRSFAFRGLDCTGYRLPTGAEWEYAARAGTTTSSYAGALDEPALAACENPSVIDDIAWHGCNAAVEWEDCTPAGFDDGLACTGPQAVGTLTPNAWGLHDTLGNVAEWVWETGVPTGTGPVVDPVDEPADEFVLRGGSFVDPRASLRAAARVTAAPEDASGEYGFRLVRTAEFPERDAR